MKRSVLLLLFSGLSGRSFVKTQSGVEGVRVGPKSAGLTAMNGLVRSNFFILRGFFAESRAFDKKSALDKYKIYFLLSQHEIETSSNALPWSCFGSYWAVGRSKRTVVNGSLKSLHSPPHDTSPIWASFKLCLFLKITTNPRAIICGKAPGCWAEKVKEVWWNNANAYQTAA